MKRDTSNEREQQRKGVGGHWGVRENKNESVNEIRKQREKEKEKERERSRTRKRKRKSVDSPIQNENVHFKLTTSISN